MNTERIVHAHEVSEDRRVAIVVQGEIDLDMLESVEAFCHRQRFRLCKRMQEELAQREQADSKGDHGV